MAMDQNPNRTPSEHPNPHENRLKWVVHLPQNGTICFDPQPIWLLVFLGFDCGSGPRSGPSTQPQGTLGFVFFEGIPSRGLC